MNRLIENADMPIPAHALVWATELYTAFERSGRSNIGLSYHAAEAFARRRASRTIAEGEPYLRQKLDRIFGCGDPWVQAVVKDLWQFRILDKMEPESAVRVAHEKELAEKKMELSPYYIALEIRAHYAGMMIATDAQDWAPYHALSTQELAKTLVSLAAHLEPRYLRSHPRKPKPKKKKGLRCQACSAKTCGHLARDGSRTHRVITLKGLTLKGPTPR